MSIPYPTITSRRGRVFPCYPAALLALIIDSDERLLMLSNPKSDDEWECINGGMDAYETILDGTLREIREEAGSAIQVRPLGIVHAYTYAYDEQLAHVFSIVYLLEYLGGEVIPGDDMAGSRIRWFSVDELESGEYTTLAPNGIPWVFRRAVELYRLLKNQPDVELQPRFDENPRPKYGKA